MGKCVGSERCAAIASVVIKSSTLREHALNPAKKNLDRYLKSIIQSAHLAFELILAIDQVLHIVASHNRIING